MKSPITGKDMILAHEQRTFTFRKESFEIYYQYYVCVDSHEQFTTTELDEVNTQMLYNQYRVKHHIPLPEEITAIRKKYDLSASRMGDILGFGPNTYGQYEKGDLPSMANAKLLRVAEAPIKFYDLVKDWEANSEHAKAELLKKVQRMIEEEKSPYFDAARYFMGNSQPDKFTGFKKPDYQKLTEMIVFFAEKVSCYKTKMNKLLFYADFVMFKQFAQSMSGTRYQAIDYGPVPNNFESIFEHLERQSIIEIFRKELHTGGQTQFLKSREDRPFNKSLFSESELRILDMVSERFKETKPYEIVEISHQEKAWIDNRATKAFISYDYALDLKAI